MPVLNISSYANSIISENHENHNVISVNEVLSHDGCDIDGPKSDLYDLFVVVKNSVMPGIYDYYYYHCEDWFSENKEDSKYYLEKKIRTCDLIEINNFNDLNKL